MIIRLQVFLGITFKFYATTITGFVFHQRFSLQQSRVLSTYSSIQSALKTSTASIHDERHFRILMNERRTSERVQSNKLNYDIQSMALNRYKELYGTVLVPDRFEVPVNCSLWPSETWNLKLGNFVSSIREKKLSDKRMRFGFECTRDAFVRYKELNGDMLVPSKFVVPCSPDWPTEIWSMKLGSITSNVRRGSSYAEHRSELQELGFDFNVQHKYGYELVRRALVTYKELHGHTDVPSRFIVPADHSEWHSDLAGINLGIVVQDIRRGIHAEHKEDLLSLGFNFVIRKKFDYECVKIAVYKYRELNHGMTKISVAYKIHPNDPWYPEETWGMCLGGYARRIKEGSLWPEKSKELFGE